MIGGLVKHSITINSTEAIGEAAARMSVHLEMITEKPSSQGPQLPVTPHMLKPRGGTRVCLMKEAGTGQWVGNIKRRNFESRGPRQDGERGGRER
jgi:hypothetical protein